MKEYTFLELYMPVMYCIWAVCTVFILYWLSQIAYSVIDRWRWSKRKGICFSREGSHYMDRGTCIDKETGKEISHEQYLKCGEQSINLYDEDGFYGERKVFKARK